MRIFILLLLFCISSFADRDGGPYVGIAIGNSSFYEDGLYKKSVKSISYSRMYYVGAHINNHLSVEIEKADFKHQETSFATLTINTLVHYQFFEDNLNIFIKIGVGNIDSKIQEKSLFTYVFGLGISYKLSDMFSIRVAYDRYNFGVYDVNEEDYNMNLGHSYTALEIKF